MIPRAQIGKTVVRIAGGILVLAVFYTPLLLLDIFPHRPRSFIGWAILALVGIPAALGLEALSDTALSRRQGRAVSPAAFSVRRTLFVIAFVVVVLGVLYASGFFTWPFVREYFF